MLVLSFLLSPRCTDSESGDEQDRDCALRESGADFLGVIVDRYQDSYPNVRNRTAEKLLLVFFGHESVRMS
jgi:hypothetical protein